ncbi:hypothetical protein AVO45_11935 [Ruegeria marisrubri]|uniref:Uncharacterized protein n=1 Tax=Ruegeria marisrubri TaxID=1685379 RepID=A0A0X3TL76_9RHOB|nr:hypothetical protein [Ruegeria marisrubri]KUJ76493.1 hypothetical protein AVO45_11935 [Ruegeria marisrubri]
MELIADILLVAGALGAGLYCFVLARRLKRFTDLEKGVGGAVAALASQAEELNRSLAAARSASDQSNVALEGLTERAESVAQRLELMMASMHDVLPDGAEDDRRKGNAAPEEPKDREQDHDGPEPAAEPVFYRRERGTDGVQR